MFIIGLTGGIATGKSTVCQFIAEHYHTPIIDADVINAQLLKPHQLGYQALLKQFPDIPLLENQQLDKHYLREQIFNHTIKKKTVEQLLHPLIKHAISEQLTTLKTQQHPYCIIAVPLLIEAQFDDLVDTIWVTDCDEKLQLQRLLQRDAISKSLALTMIDAQLTRAERLKHADAIIPTHHFRVMQQTIIQLFNALN